MNGTTRVCDDLNDSRTADRRGAEAPSQEDESATTPEHLLKVIRGIVDDGAADAVAPPPAGNGRTR